MSYRKKLLYNLSVLFLIVFYFKLKQLSNREKNHLSKNSNNFNVIFEKTIHLNKAKNEL